MEPVNLAEEHNMRQLRTVEAGQLWSDTASKGVVDVARSSSQLLELDARLLRLVELALKTGENVVESQAQLLAWWPELSGHAAQALWLQWPGTDCCSGCEGEVERIRARAKRDADTLFRLGKARER